MTRIFMNWKYKCMAVLALVLALFRSAGAIVIDFESVVTGICQVTAGGSVDGFTLSPAAGATGAGFNNSTACAVVAPTANSGTQYMTQFASRFGEFTIDTETFTLNSLYVHASEKTGNPTVRFQGLDGIGGNILNTVDVAISASWQQIFFSGWTGLKTFTWDSIIPDQSNISIDDFDADPIPEPSTLLLLASGLAGLGFFRWRRKREA